MEEDERMREGLRRTVLGLPSAVSESRGQSWQLSCSWCELMGKGARHYARPAKYRAFYSSRCIYFVFGLFLDPLLELHVFKINQVDFASCRYLGQFINDYGSLS
jgi:hypothetical protein